MSGDPFRIGKIDSFGGANGVSPLSNAAPPAAATGASPTGEAPTSAGSDLVNLSGEAHDAESAHGSGLASGLASTWSDAPAAGEAHDPGFTQNPAPQTGFSPGSTFCSHGRSSGEPGFQNATTFSTPLLNA